MRKYHRGYLLLILTILSLPRLLAGTIEGTVVDKDSQEPLIGASVMIAGTAIGVVTDIDGNYVLTNLPAGTYKVKVSYISYETRLIENVVVSGENKIRLDIVLSVAGNMLDALEIVDFARTNTENAVLMEIKKASLIASGISSQQISKTLDRDAAQVVRRVPGVVVSGNFINIRGLNPRYNNVMMHNAVAPSLETDVKAFSFDMIPSGQLDRIMVYKSPSPEISGDFAGGLVKIYTKSIPDSNFYSFSYLMGFRTGTTFSDFEQLQPGKAFPLGFDGGYFELPSSFPADVRNVNDAGELVEVGRSLKNNWVADSKIAIPDQRFSFTTGHRIQGDKALIGHFSALNYSNTRSFYTVNRSDYNAYDEINNESDPIYDFKDAQYNNSARTSILHNWSFKFRQRHTIEIKNLANFSATAQHVARTGQDYEFNYFPENHAFDQVFRGLYSGQIIGNHTLPSEAVTIDWITGYSFTYRDEPDYKKYRSEIDTSSGQETLYVPIGQAQANFLGRFYSMMKEHVITGGTNVSYRIGYVKNKSFLPVLQAGIYTEYKDRKFDARNIGFIRANADLFDTELLNGTIDQLFQPENINTTTGVIIDEQTNPNDSYDASNLLGAAYAKIELPLNKFRIVTGLRYEYNQQRLESADLTNRPVMVNNVSNSLLPSLNVSFDINDKMLLRTAYGMSVNRPEFREIAPFGFYDFNYNFTFKGNPELENCTIHNAEFKWEWYPEVADAINLSFFYKHFVSPIEVVYVPGGGSGGAKNFSFANAKNANLFGIEVEVKRNFQKTASPFLQRLGLLFNASYIHSKIDLGNANPAQENSRPLQGQAPYIVNAGMFYNDKVHNYQVNVLYNVVGKKIAFVGYEDYPDIYELPRHMLDISLSYLLPKGVELNAGVADIVNNEVKLIQDGNQDGHLDKNNDQEIQSYRPGRTFSLGIKYTF